MFCFYSLNKIQDTLQPPLSPRPCMWRLTTVNKWIGWHLPFSRHISLGDDSLKQKGEVEHFFRIGHGINIKTQELHTFLLWLLNLLTSNVVSCSFKTDVDETSCCCNRAETICEYHYQPVLLEASELRRALKQHCLARKCIFILFAGLHTLINLQIYQLRYCKWMPEYIISDVWGTNYSDIIFLTVRWRDSRCISGCLRNV